VLNLTDESNNGLSAHYLFKTASPRFSPLPRAGFFPETGGHFDFLSFRHAYQRGRGLMLSGEGAL
jgi:hypothetical protein